MFLVIPVVSTEVGPDWASEINEALTLVDSHDHSAGKGTQITPAGFVIDDDLDFNTSYAATNMYGAYLASHAASLGATKQGLIYRVGTNLWYNNGSGTAVQITSGSSVNASGTGTVTASTPSAYPYTVVTGDAQKVLLVSTGSARTLTLPSASNPMFFMIKDVSGSAQTNNITVNPDGADTIEGAASWTIRENYNCTGLVSDGVSQWFVV